MNKVLSKNVLRLPDVKNAVALGRSTIYDLIKKGLFPRPVQLSLRAVGWLSSDIETWLASREIAGGAKETI